MTFHERQTLVRSVLEEVVINDNLVKLYLKIPVPKPNPNPPGTPKPCVDQSMSTQFDLRSRADHRGCPVGRWRALAAKRGFLFPVRALSKVFRGKYLGALSQAFEQGELRFAGQTTTLAPPKAFTQLLTTLRAEDWVVYSKRPFAGPKQVVAYLGRYAHRVAISNERLLRLEQGTVHFRWRDYAHGNKTKTMNLPAEEFIRRFLLHVLPKGFMRIRHFGLLANRHRAQYLARARRALDAPSPLPAPTETAEAFLSRVMGLDLHRCPHCQQGRLRLIGPLPPTPKATGPPLPWAA